MPRHPRLFLSGAIYHIYCRVARGEFVFDDDFESIEFTEALRSVDRHAPSASAGRQIPGKLETFEQVVANLGIEKQALHCGVGIVPEIRRESIEF